jgi:acetyltransferase-like isoleucine patch superfamily enzyme
MIDARFRENPYLSGALFGLPASCEVHQAANIAGRLRCGERCRIDAFVTITGDVLLGDGVHIGNGAALFGTYGIEIGTGTSISPGAMLFSASENPRSPFTSNPQAETRDAITGPIKIGRRCVIGAGSVVLPEVVVEDEVVVGALSLVRDEDSPLVGGLVYGGTPLRRLCIREAVL